VWSDVDHPADPYPGAVPPVSYVHVAGVARGVEGCAVDGVPLDAWLRSYDAAPLADRLPVLAYGSNRCPSKITWLRRELGLGADPVVVLRARTTGVAAVWAAGLRARDGARPAVLAAAPGVVEDHAVWLATPDQIAVLDRCEGRDERFRLARLRTGSVLVDRAAFGPARLGPPDGHPDAGRPPAAHAQTDPARPPTGSAQADPALSPDGLPPASLPTVDVPVERPWVYIGHAEMRRPLLVDGQPVRCAEVAQEVARTLSGETAATDGLDADPVTGAPHPDEWPAALFAYGLLQPGQVSWARVREHATGPAWPTTVAGGVFDTGRGYPAWLPDVSGVASGVVVPIRDPADLLPTLDAYEGPAYERIRVVAGGTVCWAYAWRADRAGLVALPDGWAGAR
jgi:gamma-glutamylcyclotransferase (GGCT)/AIG2-like uncharacterized protein YtfP